MFELNPATINLPMDGSLIELSQPVLKRSTDGMPMPEFPANIYLSYEASSDSLIITFNLLGNNFTQQNQYIADNSPMWNQEVFELFIAAGHEAPQKYLELEINPNGALFSAYIDHPNAIEYFSGREKGVVATVENHETRWSGKISLPLNLLHHGKFCSQYRLNFYRLVSLQTHALDANNFWSCTPETCAYLAFNPTQSGDKPAFHRPDYFSYLNLISAE